MLTLKNGSLVSAQSDNTMRIWDAKSGDLLNIWTEHANGVNSLEEFREGYLASGGYGGIKI